MLTIVRRAQRWMLRAAVFDDGVCGMRVHAIVRYQINYVI
jgi:hypothetical protein